MDDKYNLKHKYSSDAYLMQDIEEEIEIIERWFCGDFDVAIAV